VSTLSQDSGLVSSQDESAGKGLLMDLDDRVRMSIGEDDYLQPKMSSASTYLDLVDSSDTGWLVGHDCNEKLLSPRVSAKSQVQSGRVTMYPRSYHQLRS